MEPGASTVSGFFLEAAKTDAGVENGGVDDAGAGTAGVPKDELVWVGMKSD